jgi:uncharacterized membrane protein YjfL (UPF0719 family)
MSEKILMPVMAALVVGAAFVILFTVIFAPVTPTFTLGTNHITVTII